MALVAGLLYVCERRWRLLSDFVAETSTALNLAVARIVVTGMLLLAVNTSHVFDFFNLDPALRYPLDYGNMLWDALPFSEPVVHAVYIVFHIACLMSLFGVFSRVALLVTAGSSFYLIGLPNLFGKVNHDEIDLVLFCFLLAASSCCDTLSIDSIVRGIRGGDRGEIIKSKPSPEYAFPVKAMILIFVCLYFFPGAWKVARWWGNWFTSQNMYLLISGKLSEIEATPIRLWVLRQPWALMTGAVVTILFEIGFIFLLLGKRIRPLGVAIGLAFHNVTALLMGISFFGLQVGYAVLIDWSGLLSWIARRRKLEAITILYDPHCKLCRRTMGVLFSIDWLDLLKPSPNSQPETWTPELRALVGDQDISNRFGAADAPRQMLKFGYDAYIEIARRLPLLWWFAPIMRLAPVRAVGEVIYERVANSRTCSFRDKAEHRGISYIAGNAGPLLKLFTAVILIGMVLTGIGHRVNAWPLACFPTFDSPPYTTRRLLHIDAKDVNGNVYSWDLNFDTILGRRFGTERWQGMLDRCVQGDTYTTSERCRAILELWTKFHKTEAPLSEARFIAEEHPIGYLEDKGARARFPLITLTNI